MTVEALQELAALNRADPPILLSLSVNPTPEQGTVLTSQAQRTEGVREVHQHLAPPTLSNELVDVRFVKASATAAVAGFQGEASLRVVVLM